MSSDVLMGAVFVVLPAYVLTVAAGTYLVDEYIHARYTGDER